MKVQRLAVAAGAVAVLAVGATAFAQTTGDERIYACVNNGDGTMRQVAGANVACAKNWHQISWSSENAPAQATTTYVKQRTVVIEPNFIGVSAAAQCNDDDPATGGGYRPQSQGLEIIDSRPDFIPGSDAGAVFDNSGWEVEARKLPGQQPFTATFFVFVVCQHTE